MPPDPPALALSRAGSDGVLIGVVAAAPRADTDGDSWRLARYRCIPVYDFESVSRENTFLFDFFGRSALVVAGAGSRGSGARGVVLREEGGPTELASAADFCFRSRFVRRADSGVSGVFPRARCAWTPVNDDLSASRSKTLRIFRALPGADRDVGTVDGSKGPVCLCGEREEAGISQDTLKRAGRKN